MSNDIVNYDEELAKLAKKQMAVEKPSSSTISARAGVLSYNRQPVPGNKLEVIIIASTHANLYYEDEFNPDDPKNPVCYAYSEDGEEMAPHPKSSKPQHDNCKECWANQWNSAEKGKGKACKNTRILAAVPGGVTTEDITTAEVATMSLPVMSVSKKWAPYVNKVGTLFNLPVLAMKTEIGTMPDQKAQFLVTFEDKGVVDKALIPGLLAKAQQPQVKTMMEREYDPNPEPSAEDEAKAEKSKKRGGKF